MGPVAAVVLALGAFPALTGHANAGEYRPLTLTADILHVWAVGCWIGGLSLVLWLEWLTPRRVETGGGPSSLLPILVPRFSPLAMVSVAVLLMSGIAGAWVHLDGLTTLLDTAYGRLLLAKVVLAGSALVLGAVNWRRLTPRLGSSGGQKAMRKAAALELAVANAVLVATAILVRTAP